MKIDTHLSDHCITEQDPNKNTTGTTNPTTIMNQMAIIDKLEITTVEIILTIQIISKTGIEIQQIKLQQNPIIKEDQSNKEMNIISLSLSEILRCLGNRFPIITACIHKVSKNATTHTATATITAKTTTTISTVATATSTTNQTATKYS